MVEELVSALLGVAVLSTVVFGTHALFPRSAKGVAFATVVNFGTLTLMTLLRSGLVGPYDLSPMLTLGPFAVVCAVLWFFWKARSKAKR
jgi:hypothetical protein